MKIVHAAAWYFPESTGGTEVYVAALATHLRASGVSSVIAAAADTSRDYEWEGIPVHRYGLPQATHHELVNALPPPEIDAFKRWLEEQRPDVYHQHSWSRGCGLAHLRVAKELGLRIVLTAHVPSFTCLRGDMMRDGRVPCDGKVDVARCTACWGAARGIPRFVTAWQGQRSSLSTRLGQALPESRLQTALLTPSLVERHQAQLNEVWKIADKVVAVSKWLHEALRANGAPAEKLELCPQGVDDALVDGPEMPAPVSPRLRVGYLGRWDPIKGVDVIVDVFSRLSADVDAQLVIRALPGDREYESQVRERAAGHSRITFAEPVGRDQLRDVLRQLDLLAVPSQCLETGPLVALEAQACGVPVLGSDLGGLREVVVHGRDGLLIPHDDVDAWVRAIAEYAATPVSARLHPVAPRTSADVAKRMMQIYHAAAA